jgi:hypothetical protein
MARLNIDMSAKEMIMAMCDGNPGCIRVLADLFRLTPEIDRASALEGFGPITMLDEFGIYGSQVWVLYKDMCNEKYWKVIGLIRAVQCGFTSKEKLKDAIDYADSRRGPPPTFDIPSLLAQVKEYLGDDFVIPEESTQPSVG